MLLQNLNKVAFAGEGFSFSYAQLLEQIDYYTLKISGKAGQKVLLFSENRPEWVFALYAAWLNHAVVIPVDHLSSADEIAYIISDSEPEVVFCSAEKADIVRYAAENAGYFGKLLIFEEIKALKEYTHPDHAGIGMPGLSDIALITYTSGTTGKPKGVMLTFKNLLTNIIAVSEQIPIITENEKILMLLPVHHILPLMGTIVIPFYAGSTVVMANSMRSEDIISALRVHEVTILIGVPRLYSAIIKGINDKINKSKIAGLLFKAARFADSRRFSKLLFGSVHKKFGGKIKYLVSGGAAIDTRIVKDLNALGFVLLEGYGMSEAAPMIAFNRPSCNKIGSVGLPVPGVQVEIRENEVVAKGDNIMAGYYRKEPETREVLIDGWLYTGDLGYIDNEGYLFITGRKKEIIVLSNGKKINPEEVENKLEKLTPAIKEVGIYELNDALHALIHPDFEWLNRNTAGNIYDYFKWTVVDNYNSQVSPYKKILGFSIVKEELPKTRLGKIQHFKLEQFTEQFKKRTIEDQFKSFKEYVIIKKFMEEQLEKAVNPYDHIEMDLAMDSLGLISLSVFIHSTFGTDIKENEFGKFGSVAKLAGYIRDNRSKMTVEDVNWKDILKSPIKVKLPRSGISGSISRYISRIFLRIYFRIKAEGLSNLPDEPCIIAPNHQSFFDGFFLAAVLRNRLMRKTYFYAKEKHFRAGWLKAFARSHNIVIMDINKDLRQSIQKLAEILKKGRNVVIFPEGTRSKDGSLGTFRKTFAILSQELNIPVVPVIIDGSLRALPQGSWFPRPLSRISIRILEPVLPVNHTYESLRDTVFQKISYELG